MKMTQKDRVLKYMRDNGSITPFEAFTELGITRLAARICELQHTGQDIISEPVETVNRYGERAYFTRYRFAM